mgnify:CR=1 FL=1
MYKEKDNFSRTIFNIIASVIGAMGIAGIFYVGALTTITPLLYVTLALGILGSLYFLFTFFCNKKKICICFNKTNLITSSIGAIITSIVALSANNLEIAALSTAFLIGSVGFFFFSAIIHLLEILLCNLCSKDNCCND